jgi:hypothetical protein
MKDGWKSDERWTKAEWKFDERWTKAEHKSNECWLKVGWRQCGGRCCKMPMNFATMVDVM